MSIPEENPVEFLSKVFPLNLLTIEELEEIAPYFEPVNLQKSNVLYETGSIPDFLYIVRSGTVRATKAGKRDLKEWLYRKYSSFGEEIFTPTEYRFSNAVCETSVELLRINKTNLQYILSIYPILQKGFRLTLDTFRLSLKGSFPWLSEGERITLISRRHPIFLFLRAFISLIVSFAGFGVFLSIGLSAKSASVGTLVLAFLVLGVGLLISVWAVLEWTNDYFIITEERVLVQKKLIGFFETRQESPLSAILSSGLETSIWGRMIGFGTVAMRSYTGDLKFSRLPSPQLIFDLMENQRYRVVRETRLQEKEDMRVLLDNRLSGNPVRKQKKATPIGQEIASDYQGGSVLDLLARFFGLRMVKDSGVIYRTHWWILLKKTFLPALILLLVGITVLIGAVGLSRSLTGSTFYLIAIIVTILSWGWWIYQYVDWHNDIYIITADQLIDVNKKPLGTEEKRSAPVKNIQTVQYTRKGIIGILLNFGTVKAQIGNEELTFDNTYDPASIQAEIYRVFKRHNEKLRQSEQEKMADWIETYDEIKFEGKTVPIRNKGDNNG